MHEDITAQELLDRLDKEESLTLIDVRQPIERASYHIGGLFIPLNDLPQNLSLLPASKDEEIIVYCRAGLRSDTAKEYLLSLGYIKVRNLLGGLQAVQRARR